MDRISESDLILPSLHLLNESGNKKLTTTQLIVKLRELLNPQGEDLLLIQGRSDDKFSQKVRNLRVHRTLEKNNYTTFDSSTSTYTLEEDGKNYLTNNLELLSTIIEEENFINMYASQISDYYEACIHSLNLTYQLSLSNNFVSPDQKRYFNNMLYSSIITSLETYLFDALKVNIAKKEEYFVSFVEKFEDYKEKKIKLQDLFSEFNSIESTVEKSLMTLMYHNLTKVSKVYKNCFGIELPVHDDLKNAILKRHDLVHRNGKRHDGTLHSISNAEILELKEKVLKYVNETNEMLNTLDVEVGVEA